jgi:hypothetical protein
LSFSALKIRSPTAVKSVVSVGTYSSNHRRAGAFQRLLEGGDAVAAEGVVLRERRDGRRLRPASATALACVLGRIARGRKM